jgi:acyl-CoA thioesterase I
MRSLARSTLRFVLAATILVSACSAGGRTGAMTDLAPGSETPPAATGHQALRYVALGDSYTIGTSVAEAESWPDQLSQRVSGLRLVANLGVNGYTSRDVIERELPRLEDLDPQFVSLLIGVNDVVQGVPPATYAANVDTILDDLIARVGSGRMLLVTTPDYTVTPAGADYGNPPRQAAGIREANRVLAAAAASRGVLVVDIYDLSLRAKDDRSLVASDGLHPSGTQYRLWVERIAPAARALLAERNRR